MALMNMLIQQVLCESSVDLPGLQVEAKLPGSQLDADAVKVKVHFSLQLPGLSSNERPVHEQPKGSKHRGLYLGHFPWASKLQRCNVAKVNSILNQLGLAVPSLHIR